jgi:hypothetical protein
MRSWFLFVSLAIFSTALLAQLAGPTPGLKIVTIVHEPSAGDVGPYIAGLHIAGDVRTKNPNFDPLQPNGEAEFLPAYGNGKGYADELDSISDEFYAIGSTTTHELAVLLNTTGADITIDSTTITLASERPANDPEQAPEQSSPDGAASKEVFWFDPVSVTIPDGSSMPILMVRTKWGSSLDTSPRDYIWTFTFADTGANQFVVEAPITVPKVGGSNPSGCVSSENGYPTSVWLVAVGGLVAIVVRRKLLTKARA